MMTVDNSYDSVAQHCRTAHKRDVLFGVMIAIMAAFALGSLRTASNTVAEATPPPSHCLLAPSC